MNNLLPCDGVADYYGQIMSSADALNYFNRLMDTVDWQHDEVFIFGKHYITRRKAAWFADAGISYAYSGTVKNALTWTPALLELRELVSERSGEPYNSCLLNLYHDGLEGMGWHSDNEATLVPNAAIASLSLGAERKFSFRHRQTRDTRSVILENGSLLVMKGSVQQHWQHSLPKSRRVQQARINLTFRKMA